MSQGLQNAVARITELHEEGARISDAVDIQLDPNRRTAIAQQRHLERLASGRGVRLMWLALPDEFWRVYLVGERDQVLSMLSLLDGSSVEA